MTFFLIDEQVYDNYRKRWTIFNSWIIAMFFMNLMHCLLSLKLSFFSKLEIYSFLFDFRLFNIALILPLTFDLLLFLCYISPLELFLYYIYCEFYCILITKLIVVIFCSESQTGWRKSKTRKSRERTRYLWRWWSICLKSNKFKAIYGILWYLFHFILCDWILKIIGNVE